MSTPFQAKQLLAYLSTRLQQLLYEALEKGRNQKKNKRHGCWDTSERKCGDHER